MPHSTFWSVVVTLSLAIAAAARAEDEDPADEFPQGFLQEWAAAWRTGNVSKMMDFYEPGEETTAVESLGRVRRGSAAIRKMYKTVFEELQFDRVTLIPITRGRQGSVAWAMCRYKAEIRLRSDGRRYVLEVRGSFVMKEVDGKWKIVHEHFSTIPDIPRVRPAEQ